MKILFITDNFPPEVNAPATRTYEHCLEWISLGAETTVITCAPNFPHGRVYEGYSNRLYKTEIMNGIRVIRVWSYITANRGFVRRILDYFSFACSAFLAGLFRRTDIIIATSPQFFTTFAACALSAVRRKPWIFELRDLWPESIKTVGAMKDGVVIRLLEKIELFLYVNASVVVALTDAFKGRLVSRGIPEGKIRVITNGSNLELFTPTEKNTSLMHQLGFNGKFMVGYIGTHGMAHGLEFIIDAIERLGERDKFHFLFIGDGAKKEAVVRRAGEKGLDNITFLEPIQKEQVPSYLSLIDAMLVPLIRSDTFKTVIPSKIFEAAAMHKPILLGVEGQAKEIVDGYGAGLCFEPENEEDFIIQLRTLREKKDLYESFQKGCTKLAADFDRKLLARTMLTCVEETIRNGKGRDKKVSCRV
ncbi:MAG: glycosyltransferase family 4 protein [Syntrophorhabdaceae bacterium]